MLRSWWCEGGVRRTRLPLQSPEATAVEMINTLKPLNEPRLHFVLSLFIKHPTPSFFWFVWYAAPKNLPAVWGRVRRIWGARDNLAGQGHPSMRSENSFVLSSPPWHIRDKNVFAIVNIILFSPLFPLFLALILAKPQGWEKVLEPGYETQYWVVGKENKVFRWITVSTTWKNNEFIFATFLLVYLPKRSHRIWRVRKERVKFRVPSDVSNNWVFMILLNEMRNQFF